MKDQIYFRYGAKIPPIDLSVPDLFLSSLAILLCFVLMFSFFGGPDRRVMALGSLQNLVYLPLQWSLISWIALRHSKVPKVCPSDRKGTKMNIREEQWGSDTDRRQPHYWEQNLIPCHSANHKSHTDGSGIEPWLTW